MPVPMRPREPVPSVCSVAVAVGSRVAGRAGQKALLVADARGVRAVVQPQQRQRQRIEANKGKPRRKPGREQLEPGNLGKSTKANKIRGGSLRGGRDAMDVLRVLLRVLLRHLCAQEHTSQHVLRTTTNVGQCTQRSDRRAVQQQSAKTTPSLIARREPQPEEGEGAYRGGRAQAVRVRRRRRHRRRATVGIRQTPQSTL